MVAPQRLLARLAALALLAGLTGLAHGKTRADCENEYKPQLAQEGKDVIWAPTADAMVVRMLEMAKVTPADKVYDLGAGDGKIAIAAAKHFGATAIGVEYEPDLVKHAQCLAEAEGVEARVTFVQGDIFETDFSDATVVTLYLLPALNLRLRPTLLAMRPGTRVVSYSFSMGEWEPDEQADTDEGLAYLWIVPANVEGVWTFRAAAGDDSFEAKLDQAYQHLRGSAGGATVTGHLAGDRIELEFRQRGEQIRVTGTVSGDRIAATVSRGGTPTRYVASRQ